MGKALFVLCLIFGGAWLAKEHFWGPGTIQITEMAGETEVASGNQNSQAPSPQIPPPNPAPPPAAPNKAPEPPKIESKAPAPETRLTGTGAIYTRDFSRPDLGEAYRDSRGLIWGDVFGFRERSKNRANPTMTARQAADYCARIGARLPSKAEFELLAEEFGAGSNQGFSPYRRGLEGERLMVLPGSDKWYWSSSREPQSGAFYSFNAETGVLSYIDDLGNPLRDNSKRFVRCVFAAPRRP
jgi:hypothetical protein